MGRLKKGNKLDLSAPCRVHRLKDGTWKVLQNDMSVNVPQVTLKNCHFDVDLEQHHKIAASGRRGAVHAYAVGTFCRDLIEGGELIDYNPLKFPYFFKISTSEPIYQADYVRFDKNGAFAILK